MDLNEYTENLYDLLIDQIRFVRKGKGITQKKIADDLGISTVTYSDMESGKIKFSVVRLFAVMKYLQIVSPFLPAQKMQSFEHQIRKYYNILKQQQNLFEQVNSKILNLKEENQRQANYISRLEKENLEIKDLLQEMLRKLEAEL